MQFPSQKGVKNNQAWLFLGVFLAFLTLLNLSACGFHLKGTGSLGSFNFHTVKLSETAGVRAEVMRGITRQLKASGVVVTENLAEAQLEIRLQPTQYQASQTSLSAQGDTASELLKMSQAFSAVEVANERLVVAATVNSLRDRRINSAAALASNQELKTIQKQMAQDLASQILDRIARASNQKGIQLQ